MFISISSAYAYIYKFYLCIYHNEWVRSETSEGTALQSYVKKVAGENF